MHTLVDKINAKDFVVTAELNAPKGTDLSDLFSKADSLKGWVDAVNLTESPRVSNFVFMGGRRFPCHGGHMSIAPTAVARLLLERKVQAIVQMTSRDRNRIAIQSELLGAAVLGGGSSER